MQISNILETNNNTALHKTFIPYGKIVKSLSVIHVYKIVVACYADVYTCCFRSTVLLTVQARRTTVRTGLAG